MALIRIKYIKNIVEFQVFKNNLLVGSEGAYNNVIEFGMQLKVIVLYGDWKGISSMPWAVIFWPDEQLDESNRRHYYSHQLHLMSANVKCQPKANFTFLFQFFANNESSDKSFKIHIREWLFRSCHLASRLVRLKPNWWLPIYLFCAMANWKFL